MTGEAVRSVPRTRKIVALVSAGHFYSHFYMLLLPPLFPMLREVYGVGFTELGFAVTVYSITTALTQVPTGFVVDRYGARAILVAAVALEAVAFALIGLFPVYGALLGLMVLAGLCNAVYHPADYAILNAVVAPSHMGRVFSVHTFAGYLGQASAPIAMVFLMRFTHWHTALAICALSGLAVAVLMAANSRVLGDSGRGRERGPDARRSRGVGLLFSVPVVMGLLFFAGISLTGNGINGFSVSALQLIHAAPLAETSLVLGAYLFALPVGVLAGGWLADHTRRHDLNAAACFVVSGCAIFSVAAFDLSLGGVGVLFATAGLFTGVVAPSRDMLIRAVTPPGDMGKVFGFVSTGYNIGGVLGPVMFGYLLDHGDPHDVFWAVGALSLLTVFTVLVTGKVGRDSRR